MRLLWGMLAAAVLPLSVLGQNEPPRGTPVDPIRVEKAIRDGLKLLKSMDPPFIPNDPPLPRLRTDELILLTFLHGGLPESDPDVQRLLKTVLESKLEVTYSVALQAMVLEELNRVKYQARIAQCARFLLDNQCGNGQWGYGTPTPFVGEPAPAAVASGEVRDFDSAARGRPKVVRKIPVKKMREGPPTGDNSNSQYAALGLRACHDAGIVMPKEVLALARQWWVDSQLPGRERAKGAQATPGKGGDPRGWCYKGHHITPLLCKSPDQAYASMTAGAVGALVLYDFMLGRDWKKDKAVQDGIAWLAMNFSVTENLGPPEIDEGKTSTFIYYSLYAIERLGILYGTETIGTHSWYPEGAKVILEAQRPDGSWLVGTSWSQEKSQPAWDTCFAILFLKRSTAPLVVSTDRYAPAENKGPKPDEK